MNHYETYASSQAHHANMMNEAEQERVAKELAANQPARAQSWLSKFLAALTPKQAELPKMPAPSRGKPLQLTNDFLSASVMD